MTRPMIDALTASRWAAANRRLLAKAITELMYEEVISPEVTDDGRLTWRLTTGTIIATARRRALGWWRVDPDSMRWSDDATARPTAGVLPDATDVLVVALTAAGVDASTIANFIGELSSTLLSDVTQLATARPVDELVDCEPVLADAELGGHPWIIANKGRVGFNVSALLAYPPEARRDVRLHWLAADPGAAEARSVPGLDHLTAVREQVGEPALDEMRRLARKGGLDPDTCVFLPVHPWQWTHRIMPLHAGELARGTLVHLGVGPARYRPQLAIRTLTDIDHPERRYLKLPLSILNTSVYRGLPRERTLAAPALTRWLTGMVAADPFLAETGLVLLGEVASVSVAHRVYESVPGIPYQHTEMLGAIWRDSVAGFLRPGERAVSLAALLHVDPAGRSFAGVLVERSGLTVREWFARLHEAVLPPLLHVLYRYGAMFSPHGQNCMIIHSDGVPTRLVVKDFVDDVAIWSGDRRSEVGPGGGADGARSCAEPLAEHAGLDPMARAALADTTLDAKTLVKYLQGGLIVGVYRYLAEIGSDLLGVPEPSFWALARDTVAAYQDRFAGGLGERFALFDLETPTFPKLCLNRLRLFERGYGDDPERPVISAVGSVPNPLSRSSN
jgi:siderophore synthetase component